MYQRILRNVLMIIAFSLFTILKAGLCGGDWEIRIQKPQEKSRYETQLPSSHQSQLPERAGFGGCEEASPVVGIYGELGELRLFPFRFSVRILAEVSGWRVKIAFRYPCVVPWEYP